MIRFAVVVAWATLLIALVVMAVGCGDVAAVDAPELRAAPVDAAAELPAPVDVAPELRAAPVDVAPERPSCATWTSPPYCASCRDSRGVCMCGALECCDQHCQS